MNNNFFIFTKVVVKNGFLKKHINTKIPTNVFESLITFINKSNYDNLVLVCRSQKEPTTDSLPSLENLSKLQELKKSYHIFYQNPWPESVPNFSEDKIVIRFGFDEGSEYDKNIILEKETKTDLSDGDYYYLVSSKDKFEIKTKKVLL